MAHRPRQLPAAVLQARTRQLLERDPVHAALNRLQAAPGRTERQQRQVRDLEMRLSLKYGVGAAAWSSGGERADYRAP